MEGLQSWGKWFLALVGIGGLIVLASPTPVTAFFIRGGTPPAIKQNQGPPVIVPNQQGGGGGDPTPPPPTGGGETPPGDITPPTDPPQGTPEPASLVTALLGAGLTFGYAWRKRRKSAA